MALGNVDDDDDLDAVVVDFDGPASLWLNDGIFMDSGQSFGGDQLRNVALGDMNRDGYLDAVFIGEGVVSVWMNDGHGTFTDSSQILGTNCSCGDRNDVALGDLDNDEDLDVFAVFGCDSWSLCMRNWTDPQMVRNFAFLSA